MPDHRTFSVDAVKGASDRGYTDYGDYSTTQETTSVHAILVDLLHIRPQQVESVVIMNGSQPLTLSGEDLGTSEERPPAFYQASTASAQITFIRSKQGGGVDQFAAHEITGSVQASGTLLDVDVKGPTSSLEDEPVTFTATVAGEPPPADATVTWDFGDGSPPGKGQSVTHQWEGDGRYPVHADVQTPDGGGIAGLRVKVGDPPTDPGTPGVGGDTENGPTTGGSGQGKQAGGVRGKGGAGQGGQGARGSNDSGTTGSPGTSATTNGPATASTDGGTTRRRGKQKQQPVADGERVNGILIDAALARAVPQPTGSSPKVASATTRRATDLPTDWRWLLACVPVVLLGLGSATRSRWLTRRLPEPPWRSS
ncbi:PKD domain-containing protein [Marmoricola endophyticus]|uniref:PKD domain-containing protein n=1 Tax=Marmoricola endophyticus TaxID=2040280 RepID=UPI0016689447|nr:PKD domain-containing protein [Marmoricola endophyticus]